MASQKLYPILKTAINGNEIHFPLFTNGISTPMDTIAMEINEAQAQCQTDSELESLYVEWGIINSLSDITAPMSSAVVITICNWFAARASEHISDFCSDEFLPKTIRFSMSKYFMDDMNNLNGLVSSGETLSVLDIVGNFASGDYFGFEVPDTFIDDFTNEFSSSMVLSDSGSSEEEDSIYQYEEYAFNPRLIPINTIESSLPHTIIKTHEATEMKASGIVYEATNLVIDFQVTSAKMAYYLNFIRFGNGNVIAVPHDSPVYN